MNGRSAAKIKAKKAIYFDSNDEMVCESEISEDGLNEGQIRDKRYNRVMMQATEEEKRRLRELIYK